MTSLARPQTPFAVVDRDRLDRNVARLRTHLARLGVPLRLHVKTSKSIDVAARVFRDAPGPITVSTLAEAEHFAGAGYTDILYAVGLAPDKLDRVVALRRRGVDLTVLIDSPVQAEAVAAASRAAGIRIPALIEIDCDGHRGGLAVTDPGLIGIGRTLRDGGAELRGVLDHAGESYFSATADEQRRDADHERRTVVRAAEALRAAGLPCPVVSVGSTPTAHAATVLHGAALDGVTEVRAGNFVFFDLVMAGIGVCTVEDLALSVVVTVIGHRPDKGWVLTDGGWMATSRDRGTAAQRVDQGYGLVTDLNGRVIPDLLMTGASQEHGTLSLRPGSTAKLPDLPIGTRLRILPNHACATAAQHAQYTVVAGTAGDDGAPRIAGIWPRHNGW
ncbi:alanine racemase [Dactylosporangium aurantiacum]|uniref:Alanine racemase n=1 Tax=Dactylosporangium aurantiacum TaxID=35754 RepID=A0A9Q9MGE6_9ACTN|nr:alanine racemase [Dactylosporangium aurantiacum]MDG6105017.1 alanine racemase [Dactylosporangium aurantiacum]UWZ51551.1 alanine racemase [Dactylosporangium aurantiacum]